LVAGRSLPDGVGDKGNERDELEVSGDLIKGRSNAGEMVHGGSDNGFSLSPRVAQLRGLFESHVGRHAHEERCGRNAHGRGDCDRVVVVVLSNRIKWMGGEWWGFGGKRRACFTSLLNVIENVLDDEKVVAAHVVRNALKHLLDAAVLREAVVNEPAPVGGAVAEKPLGQVICGRLDDESMEERLVGIPSISEGLGRIGATRNEVKQVSVAFVVDEVGQGRVERVKDATTGELHPGVRIKMDNGAMEGVR
jgi:hypothetical protein